LLADSLVSVSLIVEPPFSSFIRRHSHREGERSREFANNTNRCHTPRFPARSSSPAAELTVEEKVA
jgi:hypothetical protein